MKNILLIEPKSPDFNIYSMFKIPRLGLALIGTEAKRAGYDVKIIYQEAVPLKHEHILWADVIGISITTSTSVEGYRLAAMARSLDKNLNRHTPIIFGGVHATFKPEDALQAGDYVLCGEGEGNFVKFLDALNGNGALQDVPGLCRRVDGEIVRNPYERHTCSMDEVASPDWSLFVNMPKRQIGAVMTSRGCPFDCSFCSVTPMFGKGYRMRSLDLVMQDLANIGTPHVFFYDDNFTTNKRRAKELLRRIINERGTTHHIKNFSAQVRSDVARDPELLSLMKEAGFTNLYIGFESVNPETLKLYKKGQTVSDIERAIRTIRKYGIEIHGMFVFGSDADTEETFAETRRFAIRNNIETVQFMVLTPLPGSEQYKEFESDKRILSQQWNKFDAFNAVFLPKNMSPYQLQKATIREMGKFYSLPEAFRWLLMGKPNVALTHLGGWVLIRLWYFNNRKWLKSLRADSKQIFIPEALQAACGKNTPFEKQAATNAVA